MKRWEFVSESNSKNQIAKIEDIIDILLTNRGLIEKADIEAFLQPKFEEVTIESVGIDKKQLKKAMMRIKKAIVNKEQMIVFGDYDVDGITGTAILWESFHALGANVMPYIPQRVDEGYGLSIKGIENVLLQYPETKLIITVDNGIVAQEAVAFANTKNIDVIITDHHTPPSEEKNTLPKALAIVHTTKLCGAGVGYMLAQSAKYELRSMKYEFEEDRHLELVALATVADLVSLTGANRTLVKFGLEKLCTSQRIGLRALFQEAACDQKTLGVYQIGHIIAPRLNASGRLASAMDSLRLLCTNNTDRAHELARKLGSTNKERQFVMREAAEHAIGEIKNQKSKIKKLLIAVNSTYQEGIIGLVAGRIVEEFYRPAIVISRGEKYSKGSVRSVSGFNIIEFLRSVSEEFINVGGHPMAAGFTIETEKIEAFQKKLEDLAEAILDEKTLIRSIKIDCELPLHMVTQRFYTALQLLAPFGMGNPEPTFVSRNIQVRDSRIIGKDGKHMKLLVFSEHAEFEAIAFGMGERIGECKKGETIDIVYTTDENNWNGSKKLQLKLKDFKKSQ